MRLLGIITILIMTTGCALSTIKDSWHTELVGEEFFVKIYPSAVFNKPKTKDRFEKCKPFLVNEVKTLAGQLFLIISQDDNSYRLRTNLKTNQSREEFDKQFTKKFPYGDKRTEGLSDSPKALLCANRIWVGMSKEQLYFIRGLPYKINLTYAGEHGRREQVIYHGNRYYYFHNDRLESWQQF